MAGHAFRDARSVNTDLALTIAVAAGWLVAAYLADVLPGAGTAAALRRRAAALLAVVGATFAALAAVGLSGLFTDSQDHLVRAVAPLAAPAVVVAAVAVRRLTRVRRGAAAFATAPHTPAPPGLRAAAAHPLLALPIQVTALAAVAATLAAAGVVALTVPAVLGVALTAAALAAAVIGVRHALRHSRLAEGAVARPGRSARTVRVLEV